MVVVIISFCTRISTRIISISISFFCRRIRDILSGGCPLRICPRHSPLSLSLFSLVTICYSITPLTSPLPLHYITFTITINITITITINITITNTLHYHHTITRDTKLRICPRHSPPSLSLSPSHNMLHHYTISIHHYTINDLIILLSLKQYLWRPSLSLFLPVFAADISHLVERHYR